MTINTPYTAPVAQAQAGLPIRSECICVCHHGWNGYHENHVCCISDKQDEPQTADAPAQKVLTGAMIEAMNSKHHRCNGRTCTCKCERVFLESEEMLIGPDPRSGVWCEHYHGEIIPKAGMKTREWYAQNDPQSLVDSVGRIQ
jgi:hypothetical protein